MFSRDKTLRSELKTLNISFKSLGRSISLAVALALLAPSVMASSFVHPGALHTQADFDRMKSQVAHNAQPWTDGWDVLIKNSHVSLNWTANPQAMVYRGRDGTHRENYAALFNDAAAAYALALRWKVSGDDAYADKAVAILDAWSKT